MNYKLNPSKMKFELHFTFLRHERHVNGESFYVDVINANVNCIKNTVTQAKITISAKISLM